MHTFAFLIVTFFLSSSLLAQEVKFDVPTQIDIIQGQLSVVFKENVNQEKALQIINQLGYDTLAVNFSPVEVSGQLKKPITEEVLQKIKANNKIIDVIQYLKPGPILSTKDNTSNHSSTEVTVKATFQAGTPHNKAQKLLRRYIKPLSMHAHSLPNELIIEVGTQDEEAFELLQGNKHIEWVSYIGTVGGDY